MKNMPQKTVAALLVLSSAAFLVVALDSQKDNYIPGADWSENKDTVLYVKELLEGLDSSVTYSLKTPVEQNMKALASLLSAADSIFSLSQFIMAQNSDEGAESSLAQANAFWKYSLKFSVPVDLLVAVANTESHFRPQAKSSAGAAGVMQVMWKVHSGVLQANGIMSEEDLHDPEMGIAAGALVLSRYLRASADTKTALGRYYGGSPLVYWDRISKNLSRVRNAKLFATL